MSANLPDIRRELVAVLDDMADNVHAFTDVPTNPTIIPCWIVYPPETIDFMVMRDTDRVVLTVLLLANPRDPNAWGILEAAMSGTGDQSLKAALYDNRTLNGAVSNLKLLDMTSGAYSINTGQSDSVIGVEFRIEVLA